MANLGAASGLPAGVRLRSLTWEDGAAVARLAGQLGRAGELDHWRQRLEPCGHGRPLCWGVDAEARLVAQLLGHTRGDDFGLPGEVAWLELLGVHPAWQGRGLARLLAEACVEECASRGLPRVATLVQGHDQLTATSSGHWDFANHHCCVWRGGFDHGSRYEPIAGRGVPGGRRRNSTWLLLK